MRILIHLTLSLKRRSNRQKRQHATWFLWGLREIGKIVQRAENFYEQAIAEKRAELIAANKKKKVMLIGANAQLEAARIEAKSILVKAEAEAEAKRKIINAVTLEGYLKLESMNVLKEFQDRNHLIILDPNTTSLLPFLNLDKIRK